MNKTQSQWSEDALLTAADAGFTSCLVCGWLDVRSVGSCARCGARVEARKPGSVAKTASYLLAALICYVPANVYPVMTFHKLGTDSGATILEGAQGLFHGGDWPLGLLVLFASFLVPALKMISLFILLRAVRHAKKMQHLCRAHARLYRCVLAVGRWSMLDVFVMTITVALLDFRPELSVSPGVGVVFFAAVVVFTMLAAESFDPRLLWITEKVQNGDNNEEDRL